MTGYSDPLAYETWMGRWSARLAPRFLRFAGLSAGGHYLDVGAGTGVLARAIVEQFKDLQVVGVEPSASYVDYARQAVQSPRARFEVGDAAAIPFAADSFDGALALLILQELEAPEAALAEIRRVVRPSGLVAACQWDFRAGMPMLSHFWQAVQDVVPGAAGEQEAARRVPHGTSDEASMAALWRTCGLREVTTAGFQVAMDFASFDDYWRPFLGGATPTSSYAATLPEDIRQALIERLREKLLGAGEDRPFTLRAQAWAVRGLSPNTKSR